MSDDTSPMPGHPLYIYTSSSSVANSSTMTDSPSNMPDSQPIADDNATPDVSLNASGAESTGIETGTAGYDDYTMAASSWMREDGSWAHEVRTLDTLWENHVTAETFEDNLSVEYVAHADGAYRIERVRTDNAWTELWLWQPDSAQPVNQEIPEIEWSADMPLEVDAIVNEIVYALVYAFAYLQDVVGVPSGPGFRWYGGGAHEAPVYAIDELVELYDYTVLLEIVFTTD